jgi:hypothetical protein
MLINVSFLFVSNTGVWTQGLRFTTWAISIAFFTWVFIFRVGSYFCLGQPLTVLPLLCLWDYRVMCHRNQLVCWDGVLPTFCQGWSQTMILLIFPSQVARIIGMSHCTQQWILEGKISYLIKDSIFLVGKTGNIKQVYGTVTIRDTDQNGLSQPSSSLTYMSLKILELINQKSPSSCNK